MNKKSSQAETYIQIGMIISQVNLVEVRLNHVIADYYVNPRLDPINNTKLSSDLLFNGVIRLDDKLKILEKISISIGIEFSERLRSDLKQWRNIRNIVAHGIPIHNEDFDLEILFNGTFHNLTKMRKGFGARQDRIMGFLEEINRSEHA